MAFLDWDPGSHLMQRACDKYQAFAMAFLVDAGPGVALSPRVTNTKPLPWRF